MNATAVEWVSAAASAAVAVVAAAGLFIALRDSRSAAARADKAEASALADRRRLAVERRAELELLQVQLLSSMVGAAQPNVIFSPQETGHITAALDALPQDALPSTRAWLEGSPQDRAAAFGTHVPEESRQRVRDELRAEVQRLTGIAAGEDSGSPGAT